MKIIDWTKNHGAGLAAACVVACSAAMTPLAIAQVATPPVSVRGLPDFTDLVELVGPSVVNIRTMEKTSTRGGMSGMELQERLLERQSPLPIVFITGHGDVPMALESM